MKRVSTEAFSDRIFQVMLKRHQNLVDNAEMMEGVSLSRLALRRWICS